MRNILFFIVFLCLLIMAPVKIYADELCSKNGYTILTINGMLSSKVEAIRVKDSLKKRTPNTNKNEPLTVDYLYNPSHLGGVGDTADILAQGLLDYKNDYDLTEILKDASEKVKTQKVLLVAHSQGNFYANNLYDKVVDVSGGIPSKSIQVYGVGSPDNRVAGNGKYLTSDTDWTINTLAKKFLIDILPPNVHITLGKNDADGHSFSDVYMKYQGDRIVSDIQSLLNKIKSNDVQSTNEPCISTPKISLAHNGLKVVLAVLDPIASVGNYVTDGVEKASAFVGKNISRLLASAGGILGNNDTLLSQNNEQILEAEETTPGTIPDPTTSETETIQETSENDAGDSSNGNENSTGEVLSNTQPETDDTNKKHNGGGGGGSSTPEIPTCSDTQVLVDGVCVLKQIEENPIPPVTTPDTIAPVISLVGESSLNIIKDSTYIDLGATALDNIDGDLTGAIIKSGTFVDTSTVGSYTIIYTVSDLSNNSSNITRTINIIAPATPPVEEVYEIIDRDTVLTYGEYNYNNLRITNNAILTLEGSPLSPDSFKGVRINAKNIIIDSGSSISADEQGYNDGPGSPSEQNQSAGASYGGIGYHNSTSYYGNATEPAELGSGGINNFRGGGAIILNISNSLLNNGTISSNGGLSSSGGSIYVKAKNISGDGIFSSNGGSFSLGSFMSGVGAGGRLAMYYETFSFTGKVEALGGCAYYSHPQRSCAENGTIGFFDILDNNLTIKSLWRFQQNDSPLNYNKIIFTEGAIVTSEEDITVNANELVMNGTSEFILGEDQIINIPKISLDDSSKLTFSGEESINSDTLKLAGNSIVTVATEKIFTLEIPNLTIENGASLSVDAKGYRIGPGTPDIYYSGASHGGLGGYNTTSPIYGVEMIPVDFGSGGYQPYRGGGVIRLIVTDTLLNNGLISAMGDVTSSGGSIYITAKNILGDGVFSVNGGGVYCGGVCTAPGAGGRIAIYYEDISSEAKVTSLGGCGYISWPTQVCAGDGTVKLIDDDDVEDDTPVTPPIKSSDKLITFFSFESLEPPVVGNINNTDYTIKLEVPYGTDITNIIPDIFISDKSTISPALTVAQNFTNPVTYTMTAEDLSTQSYVVTVTVLPNSNPPDQGDGDENQDELPVITSYSLNGNQGNITINPLITDVEIVLNANKNVNWMYIDIEKEGKVGKHKFFHAGESCENASSCTKVWEDGILSEGGLLESGNYKVWVHIKDSQGHEYEGYLPSVITVDND